MILNHKYKYIFVKTTKTAGTSFEIALSRSCSPSDVVMPFGADDDNKYRETLHGYQNPTNYSNTVLEEHSKAEVIKKNIPSKVWNSYTKIAIIRDPIDYAISRYYWDNRSKLPKSDAPTIDEWVLSNAKRLLINWRIHTISDEPVMDYYIIYDHLVQDASTLSKILHLDYDLGEEIRSIKTKNTFRQKENPIQKESTYNFIRSKMVKENHLINQLKSERGYDG